MIPRPLLQTYIHLSYLRNLGSFVVSDSTHFIYLNTALSDPTPCSTGSPPQADYNLRSNLTTVPA
jgi:hypothetical protein